MTTDEIGNQQRFIGWQLDGFELRPFIESKPVYRLEAKDKKTAVAKLLLKDFKVQGQAVLVTLRSP